MSERFERAELIFGKEAIRRLSEKHIALFGLGGVGGYVLEALARSGVGSFTLIDNDTISVSNFNRQILATEETVGMKKIEAAKKRVLSINPNACVFTDDRFILPENVGTIDFSLYDYVIDAIDTVSAKIALVCASKEAGTAVISSMGTGNKTDPARLEVADISKTSVCPLARVMRRELRKRGVRRLKVVYSKEKPTRPLEDLSISCRAHCICPPGAERKCIDRRDIPGSVAFVPSVVGLIIAGEVVKDLTQDRAREVTS